MDSDTSSAPPPPPRTIWIRGRCCPHVRLTIEGKKRLFFLPGGSVVSVVTTQRICLPKFFRFCDGERQNKSLSFRVLSLFLSCISAKAGAALLQKKKHCGEHFEWTLVHSYIDFQLGSILSHISPSSMQTSFVSVYKLNTE